MRAFAIVILALGLFASPAMVGISMAGTSGSGDKDSSAANTPAASNGAPNSASSGTPSIAASSTGSTGATAATDKPAAPSMEAEMQELRDLLEAQANQLQVQSDQLKQQQQQMEALEAKLSSSNTAAVSPASISIAAPNALPASASPMAAAIAGGVSSSAVLSAPAQAAPADQPTSLRYRGVTLTPGGFMAAETVWRQKTLASDINTPFNSVPFDGASQAHISEFNASGRQSRISMLVQGKIKAATIGGYYEMDFLSAGTTSNNNQSNSYTLRQRQFWGQAALTNGFTFTGGQMWSLLTETSHGLDNRTEVLPQTIDAQYHAGFTWARQYGFRVVKNFNNKIWLGMSVEESQATLTVHGNPTAVTGGTVVEVPTSGTCATLPCTASVNQTTTNNFLLGAFGTSGGLYNPLGNYAYNPSPDFVFKAAFEPGFGHYEIFGVVSDFRDRAFPCVPLTGATAPAGCATITSATGAFNDDRLGGGIGANARVSVLAKKVDIGIHVFGGDGVGRYGSVGLSDLTTRPNGTLAPIRNYQALGTLQFHPTPKLDINLNAGGEFEGRTNYAKSGTAPNEGYGYALLNNSGCWTETQPIAAPGTGNNLGTPTGVAGSTGFIPGTLANCTGDTRNLIEGSIGFWYRFYRGPMGTVQWGAQYANYIRNTWHGVGTSSGIGTSGQPHADENMFFTSFRYYLP